VLLFIVSDLPLHNRPLTIYQQIDNDTLVIALLLYCYRVALALRLANKHHIMPFILLSK